MAQDPWSRIALALGLAALSACREPSAPQQLRIEPSGGTIAAAGGLVRLVVPPGAVSSSERVTVTPVPEGTLPAAALALDRTAFDVEPSALILSAPAQLTIRYDSAAMAASGVEELTLATTDSSGTAPAGLDVTSSSSPADRSVTGAVSRLGRYWIRPVSVALIDVRPSTASIAIDSTIELQATPKAADGRALKRPVSWQSRNSGIAIVRSTTTNLAVVTGVANGQTWIVAQSGTRSDSVPITVAPLVDHIDLAPDSAKMLVGDTINFVAIPRNTQNQVVSGITLTWASSDSTVATVAAVSGAGRVVAQRAGSAVISASAGLSRVSANVATYNEAEIVSVTTPAGAPVALTSVADTMVVTVRVTTLWFSADSLRLLLACTRSGAERDTVVAAAAVPNATGGTIALTIPTSAFDTISGRPRLLNGSCRLAALVRLQTGAVRRSPELALTLANGNRFAASYSVHATNHPFGAVYPVSAVGDDSFLHWSGDVTLRLLPILFDPGAAVTSISGSMFGKSFTAGPDSTGAFAILFPNVMTASNPLGISGWLSPAGGDVPTVTTSVLSGGVAGFTRVQGASIRIDNQAPQAASFTLPPELAQIAWIGGAFTFSAHYGSGGDAPGGVGSGDLRFFSAPASAWTALPGGTAVGDACSTTGLSPVSSGYDVARSLPRSTVTNDHMASVRAFEADRLGNVRCTDIAPLAIGVDTVPPQLVRRSDATPDYTVFPIAAGPTPEALIHFTASDGESGLPQQVTYYHRAPAFGASGTTCLSGFAAGCPATATTKDSIWIVAGFTEGQVWLDSVWVMDRAGNLSRPLVTHILADDYAPLAEIQSYPSTFTGGSTLTLGLVAGDDFSVSRVGIVEDYSPSPSGMSIYVPGPFLMSRWAVASYDWSTWRPITHWTGNVSVPAFMRRLEQVDGGDAPYADSAASTNAYAVEAMTEDLVGNWNFGQLLLAGKDMPEGFTWFDKGISTFRVTTLTQSVPNDSGASNTAVLAARLSMVADAVSPFSSVCFYYRGAHQLWYPAGCAGPAQSALVNGARVYDYRSSWDPPPELGASGTVELRAIGVNATGDGLVTNSNNSITLVR